MVVIERVLKKTVQNRVPYVIVNDLTHGRILPPHKLSYNTFSRSEKYFLLTRERVSSGEWGLVPTCCRVGG